MNAEMNSIPIPTYISTWKFIITSRSFVIPKEYLIPKEYIQWIMKNIYLGQSLGQYPAVAPALTPGSAPAVTPEVCTYRVVQGLGDGQILLGRAGQAEIHQVLGSVRLVQFQVIRHTHTCSYRQTWWSADWKTKTVNALAIGNLLLPTYTT